MRSSPDGRDRDGGFTLIEIIIVMLVMSIVVSIAGFSLISLSNTASRTDSMTWEEQTASSVMAQLTEDIRSAVSISFPSGASPSTQLQLTEVGTDACSTSAPTTVAGGPSYTYVLWVVSSTTGTLTREQENSSCGWVQSPFQLNYLVNSNAEPVFSYYDEQGDQVPLPTASPTPVTPLASTWSSLISDEATSVDVTMFVSTTIRGVPIYHSTDVVALTNRLQILNPSGEGT